MPVQRPRRRSWLDKPVLSLSKGSPRTASGCHVSTTIYAPVTQYTMTLRMPTGMNAIRITVNARHVDV